MRPVTLFVYGSLLAAPVLRAVLGRVPRLRSARLPGYRRRTLRGKAFPGLLRQPGRATSGAILRVSVRELRWIDRYEDDFYQRRSVGVSLDDGTQLAAQVYVLRPCHRGLVGRREWAPGGCHGRGRRRSTVSP